MSNNEVDNKALKESRVDTLSQYSYQNNLLQSKLISTNYEMTMKSDLSSSIVDSDEKLCNIKESVNSIDNYERITDENIGKCQKNYSSHLKPTDVIYIVW